VGARFPTGRAGNRTPETIKAGGGAAEDGRLLAALSAARCQPFDMFTFLLPAGGRIGEDSAAANASIE
jgi:hypothetical protein